MTEYLSARDLAGLIPDAVARDWGLLELAAARPASGFGEVEAFPTLWEKAAALFHGVLHLHPFIDGNKRTAWLGAAVFLALNDHWLEAPADEAYGFVVGTVEHHAEVLDLATWLRGHSRPM